MGQWWRYPSVIGFNWAIYINARSHNFVRVEIRRKHLQGPNHVLLGSCWLLNLLGCTSCELRWMTSSWIWIPKSSHSCDLASKIERRLMDLKADPIRNPQHESPELSFHKFPEFPRPWHCCSEPRILEPVMGAEKATRRKEISKSLIELGSLEQGWIFLIFGCFRRQKWKKSWPNVLCIQVPAWLMYVYVLTDWIRLH